MNSRFILASKSPRRYELLKQVGLDFEVIPSRVTEDFVQTESPQEHVIRLAEVKARDVASGYPDRWVIAADTIVYINGSILGKPKNREEAMEMLSLLSGQEHWVLTGFSVCHLEKGKSDKGAVQTAVRVKSLTPTEMKWYVQTGEPFDKAGGYAIQGIGSFMIESIQGSYTNVVGLPTHRNGWLSDNGSAYFASATRAFATGVELVVCTTPVESSESNGVAEAFIKTFKRDYVVLHRSGHPQMILEQLPEWFKNYNENHPYRGLKMMSPKGYRQSFARLVECPVLWD